MRSPIIILFLIPAAFLTSCKKGVDDQEVIFPSSVIAGINLSETGTPISKYIYGMFLEHLGNKDVGDLIDDGIWAEVLDDRKFFYPVDNVDELIPVNKRDNMKQWVPVGDENSVTMDSGYSYVGIHSPRITVDNIRATGIAQSGLWIRKNMTYEGRLVISGDPGIDIKVNLIWGEGKDDRAEALFSSLTKDYKKFHIKLVSRGSSNEARLEITGLGTGTFSIGAVSLMPEDNVDGFRADAIRLLKGLDSEIYRWGGNMSSAYDWMDGIGDPDQRPPRYEYAWEGVEQNDVGTHELIRFAELIDVELNLTVNAGLGGPYEAARWVEYVNGDKNTAMGQLRAKNGHPEPFGLKLWCVGNETYGWWQLGHTDLKSYIIKYNQFAEKMLEADPSIELVASGATIDEMTITGSAKRLTGTVLPDYDSEADWTGGLLRGAQNNIDYMSEHFYCSVDKRFDIEKGEYVPSDEGLEDWTRRPANRVRAKAEHYQEYRKRIPGAENIPVYLDEFAYYTNWVHPKPTLGVTIGYARALHEIFRNSDLIRMAGFTFGTSCLSFNDTAMVYNSTGLMYDLYKAQFGSIPVRIDGNSPQPEPQWPVGGEQPMKNAGSDTYPLDMVAALTENKKYLVVAIVNPTESDQKISLKLDGIDQSGKARKWTLSGISVGARNIVAQQPEVTLKEELEDVSEQLLIGAATINLYKYEVL